jgi:MFS family permease
LSLTIPRRVRVHYRREQFNWALVSFGLGAVEGAVAATFVKASFAGVISPTLMSFVVALITGAPSFSNLVSFWFAAHQLGRDKIVWLSRYQLLAMLAVIGVGLSGGGLLGLVLSSILIVLARVAWAGVLTLRSAVWRQNFPEAIRGRLVGRLVAVNDVLMALIGASLGFLTTVGGWLPQAFFVGVGLIGLLGAVGYRRMKLRGHRKLRALEEFIRNDEDLRPSWASFRRVLDSDPTYRAFMSSMFVFGAGNLMLPALMIVILSRTGRFTPFELVLALTSIPLILIPLSVGAWAKYFDARHVIEYRAVHAWSFVAVSALFLVGAVTGASVWIWLGAVMLGVGYAGGAIGWNLGHNDFASAEKATLYMGVHVTLNGIRGVIAPVVGVALFEGWYRIDPAHAAWALLLPLALNLIGALGFARLRRELRSSAPEDRHGR